MDILTLTALEAGKMIKSGDISSPELTELTLIRMRERTDLNAFISVFEKDAIARAEQVQKNLASFSSPLAGVPMGLKDVICTKGFKTTCASHMLDGFIPAYDATVWNRLLNAGAVLTGKHNTDEFAMGSTGETSRAGVTRNPHDLSRVAGGSSCGTAAAVSAGLSYYGLGSDTGGSVRQPAGYCGVCGFKPSYGAVSRYGLVAHASSLDQIGVICRDVRDCAAVFDHIRGKDPLDMTSAAISGGVENINGDMRGVRVGICLDHMDGVSAETTENIVRAAGILTDAGASPGETSVDGLGYAVAAYYIIASAEAGSNLSRYDGVKYGFRAEADGLDEMYVKTRTAGFGAEVKRRIMLGAFVLSSGHFDEYYTNACRARGIISAGFDRAFEKYDLLIGPVSPEPAPEIGVSLGDPLKMYRSDVCTVAANLAGLPAVSVPCGTTGGLPCGLQITGKRFDDFAVLNAAYAVERGCRK